jgi:hypothetical protein
MKSLYDCSGGASLHTVYRQLSVVCDIGEISDRLFVEKAR